MGIAWALSILMTGVLLIHVVWSWRFAAIFHRTTERPANADLPKATVLLPLRGADPSLEQCLNQVLNQNYPDYEVRVILDSVDDPAAPIVQEVIEQCQADHVTVSVLRNPRRTCSLKVSALLQALEELDNNSEVIAFLDEDVIPEADWLRNLAAPLQDPHVGAATGIRWYRPTQRTLGNLVRRQWSIFATVQMHALKIPWGGSLAIRAELLRRCNQMQRWTTTLCEDTSLGASLHEGGLKLSFVPQATMVNQSTTDLAACFRFIRRQTLFLRLYHPAWGLVFGVGLATSLLPPIVCLTLALLLAQMQWAAAALLASVLLVNQAGLSAMAKWTSRRIRQTLKQRGTHLPSSPLNLKTVCAAQVAILLYCAALLSALVMRRVQWRGVTYDLHRSGAWLREYVPFRVGQTNPSAQPTRGTAASQRGQPQGSLSAEPSDS